MITYKEELEREILEKINDLESYAKDIKNRGYVAENINVNIAISNLYIALSNLQK